MYKIITSIIIVFVLVIPVNADEIELPHVTVHGTSTIKIVPDKMIWNAKISNTGEQLDWVAEEHTKIVVETIKFLKEAGIKEKNIQTARMEFGENWVYKNQSNIKEGYIASTWVSFISFDFAKYKKLWIGLSKISGVSINDVNYDHTDRIKYQNEARKKAVLKAKEKAEDLAKALNSKIKEPLLIEENISRNGSSRSNSLDLFENDEGEEGNILAPGRISIKSSVKVAFRLVTYKK